MKGQVVLLEAVIVAVLVLSLLLITPPLHQDVHPLVERVAEHDAVTVSLETGTPIPPCSVERYSPDVIPLCRG